MDLEDKSKALGHVSSGLPGKKIHSSCLHNSSEDGTEAMKLSVVATLFWIGNSEYCVLKAITNLRRFLKISPCLGKERKRVVCRLNTFLSLQCCR